MKKLGSFILIFFYLGSVNIFSQTFNGLDHQLNVTSDISVYQYMQIENFVLQHGEIAPFNDLDPQVITYSFNNIDVSVVPCNTDPMVATDSIMPESNYCQMKFKIDFDSPLYNEFFQSISLYMRGVNVILEPVYNMSNPEYTMKREDLITIVNDVINQISEIDEN